MNLLVRFLLLIFIAMLAVAQVSPQKRQYASSINTGPLKAGARPLQNNKEWTQRSWPIL